MPSTIRKGSRGSDVVLCQDSLTKKGYPCEADGIFGSGTESKVKQFQGANNLVSDGIVGQGTWGKLLADTPADEGIAAPGPLPPVIAHAQSLGYETWGDPWRLWLFGVRSPSRTADSFDDMLGCCYVTDDGLWEAHYWPGTTDPGAYYLEHPMNSAGCAILVAGQYLDTWKIDLHGGKYEALCQRAGEVEVYRDPSMDDKLDLDPTTIAKGYFGINLHAATRNEGQTSTVVGKWSAGCQVHASAAGFAKMMELAHAQQDKTGLDTFSYTLMDQWWEE
jgi:peptidoglycan hydrolase-like protein with peptidoglycan-binding domain